MLYEADSSSKEFLEKHSGYLAQLKEDHHKMASCFSIPDDNENAEDPSEEASPILHNWDGLVQPLPNQVDAKLQTLMYKLLDQLDSGNWNHTFNETDRNCRPSDAVVRTYINHMRNGLEALLELSPIVRKQSWSDAVAYARAVIQEPQDTVQRSKATWARSCSIIHRELKKRFGQEVKSMAAQGCTQLVSDHYLGNRLSVSHVDKEASFRQQLLRLKPSLAYYPDSSPLAVGTYESAFLSCSLVASAWLPLEEALKYAAICHLSVCDDYWNFTGTETEVRVRLVAQSIGAAFDFGDRAINVLIDGTALQAVGLSNEVSLQSAMAWRAASGGATAYNGHTLGNETLEDGLVAPQVILAIHDLFDWRTDIAAGNSENGFFVAYGLGTTDPFHAYLEAALLLACSHPRSGVYAIASITIAAFISCRYSSYKYLAVDMELPEPCPRCVELLQALTEKAGFGWAPKSPPKSFEEGEQVRRLCQRWADRYEDDGLVQEGLGWFQSLVATGTIRMFDALVKIPEIDKAAGWV
ncbi:uncharacterized protein Triagg1_3334 [Trichoderma aggressivum f. europaeum]|uniref:Uncharacterized protein n=1 Tax=Trichoderma aggressivum f. europaeum TaxID=173218 RepID=A0AAE1IGN9_9HYPO|nr:hypothetical protein Triagg1_3334 [Trichoderma aggressivum f. europaeum]